MKRSIIVIGAGAGKTIMSHIEAQRQIEIINSKKEDPIDIVTAMEETVRLIKQLEHNGKISIKIDTHPFQKFIGKPRKK